MLNKLKRSDNQGFTIIEVMIVLAIAGLIILIVLLAVPALQRNGRNTAIKNDASAISGAVSEFKSNNDGKLPTTSSQVAGASEVKIGAATDNQASAKVQPGTTVAPVSAGAVASSWPAAADTINVYTGVKCGDTSGTLVVSKRGVVVLYRTESSGGSLGKQCVDA